jgi:hypothetical protein
MKKIYMLSTAFMFLLVIQYTRGQGLENFNNYVGSSGTYSNGSFTGQDGSTWNYWQCRSDRAINAPTPCLGKARNPTAKIISGTLHNGCGTLSFDYKQGFSTAVNLNVYVNGFLMGNVTSPGGTSDTSVIHNSGPFAVNVVGDFTIVFKQADSTASGQVSVDNVTWTGNSTVTPEPTNYPSNLANSLCGYSLTLNWSDATGGQLPMAYLVKASNQNNITLPVDGTPVPDDMNLADGSGALNILQGIQTCTFTNIPLNNHYYFKIFPYTNTGTAIDYKTDGTPPSTDVYVATITTLNTVNFNDHTFGQWTAHNILGDSVWGIDAIHGVGGTPCAKISGYNGTTNVDNEDWLISPALNFDSNVVKLTFMSAKNYIGPDLEVKISTNYDGTGNPNTFTWTDLTPNLSPGSWVWTSSGCIDLTSFVGSSVHVAFKFTSTTAGSATWELDDILITKETMTGINQLTINPDDMKIFPNPSTGVSNVSFNRPGPKEITITSLIGNQEYRTVTSGNDEQIRLNNLSKGIYFIQVKFLDSSRTITKKLIIQ